MTFRIALAASSLAFSAVAAAQSPVDACALLPAAAAEALVGKPIEGPRATPPQGAMLGMCDWNGPNGSINLSARPAREFDETVKYASRKQAATPVDVPGAKALRTRYGLFVQPAGKPYFLQVLATRFPRPDPAFSVEVAKALKP